MCSWVANRSKHAASSWVSCVCHVGVVCVSCVMMVVIVVMVVMVVMVM